MRRQTYIQQLNKQRFLSLFIFMVIAISVLMVVGRLFDFGTSMEILSIVTALIGTILVVVELKNSQTVTCCDMLIQLNNYFHDSEKLMDIYGDLEKALSDETKSYDYSKITESGVAAYCTFFENIYLLINNHIAKIEDVDALFGFRFFLLMHDEYITENYILPTSSSYSQLFELYQIWIDYREKEKKKHKIARKIVKEENQFDSKYLKNCIYMDEKENTVKHFEPYMLRDKKVADLRTLSFKDISSILELQSKTIDTELFHPLERNELIESMHLDCCIGAFVDDRLIAVCVVVKNRESSRNLYKTVNKKYEQVVTFDAVFVDKEFEGNGLQNKFLKLTKGLSEEYGAEYIVATVAPENKKSLDNFIESNYQEYKEMLMYGGKCRKIMCINIKENNKVKA